MSVIVLVLLWIAGALAAPARADSGVWAVTVGAGVDVAPAGYAHPEWLADASWLRGRVGAPDVRVVALTPVDEFERGHVPGAVQIDWPDLEVTDTSDASLARWRGEVEGKLTRLGIAPGDTVVAYDGGTLFAARLWWVLRQLGHDDVRVLDGGFPAWVTAGGAIETAGSWIGYSPDDPYAGTADADLLAQVPEVAAVLGDPAVAIVDARSADEYAAGHVPGAVNLPQAELASRLGELPRDRALLLVCQAGARSLRAAQFLAQVGFTRVTNVRGGTGAWAAAGLALETAALPHEPAADGATQRRRTPAA